LAGGISGYNQRQVGAERFIDADPTSILLGLRVSLEERQNEAPLVWYHGSLTGIHRLDPNHAKLRTPFIAVWRVYLSRYIETARVFGRYVYRVTVPDRSRLVPDPDIQELTKGDYLAVVYQGSIDPQYVTQITGPKELVVSA